MFSRILVPLDGSPLAEGATFPALKLARGSATEVLLLSVPEIETMFVPAPEGMGGYGLLWPNQSLERSRNESREYLDSLRTRLSAESAQIRTIVREGDPASIIVDVASEEKVDLIVMSTHGYTGITRWVLGSVTEKVLRSADCPVLVVREEGAIEEVMITLDGSELAERAVEPGMELATRLGAGIRFVRAVEEVTIPSGEVKHLESLERGLGERLVKEAYREADRYLKLVAGNLEPHDRPIHTTVTLEKAAEGILEIAEIHGIDLIVMATHGRSGLDRWVYGSVTEKVMRGGCCSMLIVPSHRRV